MALHATERGPRGGEAVVCVHGLAQHGGIFDGLAASLAAAGRRSISVDLRGHGASTYEPPWNLASHVDDLVETADAFEVGSATWIGHSFGGLLVAALAAREPARVSRLILLDPGLFVPPPHALVRAERDRQDWSFATADGAVNALLSGETVVAAPRDVVAAYVADDLVRGADGRLRFRYSPAAVATAWSEMTQPPPPVARVPTLLVRAVATSLGNSAEDLRYRGELGSLLTMAAVPNGHNVLWEAPAETTAAIEGFLAASD